MDHQLTWWCSLGDASHETRCDDAAVLRQCLSELWRICPEPEAIVVHGTGTIAGDAYERQGLDAGPWRHAQQIWCKPVIGHCLGASSLVELAVGCAGTWQRWWKISLGFGGHMAGVALQK